MALFPSNSIEAIEGLSIMLNIRVLPSLPNCMSSNWPVLKTTLVIIFCLLPLVFSEFKSVSQLGTITIISAIIAVLFDLIYFLSILRLSSFYTGLEFV